MAESNEPRPDLADWRSSESMWTEEGIEFTVPLSPRVVPRVAHYLRIQLEVELPKLMGMDLHRLVVEPSTVTAAETLESASLTVFVDRLYENPAKEFRRVVENCLWSTLEAVEDDMVKEEADRQKWAADLLR